MSIAFLCLDLHHQSNQVTSVWNYNNAILRNEKAYLNNIWMHKFSQGITTVDSPHSGSKIIQEKCIMKLFSWTLKILFTTVWCLITLLLTRAKLLPRIIILVLIVTLIHSLCWLERTTYHFIARFPQCGPDLISMFSSPFPHHLITLSSSGCHHPLTIWSPCPHHLCFHH